MANPDEQPDDDTEGLGLDASPGRVAFPLDAALADVVDAIDELRACVVGASRVRETLQRLVPTGCPWRALYIETPEGPLGLRARTIRNAIGAPLPTSATAALVGASLVLSWDTPTRRGGLVLGCAGFAGASTRLKPSKADKKRASALGEPAHWTIAQPIALVRPRRPPMLCPTAEDVAADLGSW